MNNEVGTCYKLPVDITEISSSVVLIRVCSGVTGESCRGSRDMSLILAHWPRRQYKGKCMLKTNVEANEIFWSTIYSTKCSRRRYGVGGLGEPESESASFKCEVLYSIVIALQGMGSGKG